MCIIKIRLFHIQEKILVESYTLSFLCHFWVLCCHFQLKLAVFLISNTLISTNLQLHPEYLKPKSPNKKKLKRKARVILLVTSQITIKFLITLIFISIFTFSKKNKNKYSFLKFDKCIRGKNEIELSYFVQHFLWVSGWETEPGTGLYDRGSRKTHNNNSQSPLQTLSAKATKTQQIPCTL